MRCGVVHDAYRTLRSLTFVLPSGTTIDTAAPDAAERFAAAEPELADGLAAMRDEIRADAELSERIRRKFEIKNTTGYRLCAFLDADEPVEIFRRLLVGSEGTLGFVAEAVLDTVPHGHHTSTGLIFFDGIDAAAAPVPDLVAAGATAVELMVNPTLIAASYALPGIPEKWGRAAARGRVPARRDAHRRPGRARRARARGPGRARGPRAGASRPPSRATRTRPRCSGACAKGCRGSSAPSARRRARSSSRTSAFRPRASPSRRATSRRCSASTSSSPASPATPRPATCTSC